MRRLVLPLALLALVPGSVLAQASAPVPRVELPQVEPFEVPAVDLRRARLADEKRQLNGGVAHFAVAAEVEIEPWERGTWDLLTDETARWRLQIRSPGALSLSLAFTLFQMPDGARFLIRSADGRERIGPFTERDNKAHRQLWTPPLLTDHLFLELTLPRQSLDDLELLLTRVHHGYAGFGEAGPRSGACQRDVACAETAAWRDAARSVGLVAIAGVRFCTGFMVNNTAHDGKPLFVTARHCGVTRKNAPSVVVMWGYESARCRGEDEVEETPAPSRHFQTGAAWRAAYGPTDVVLLELDEAPDLAWNVHYAGWDRSAAQPEGSAVIHHPNTDLKRLSLDADLGEATFYLDDGDFPDGDHLRVDAWELGTTEGGSSGAPLFDANQRVVGQLHGGRAECGERKADWFGRFAVSWHGGGRQGNRLSDWLDPLATETLTLDGLDATELLDAEVDP